MPKAKPVPATAVPRINPELQRLAVRIDSLRLDPDNARERTPENLAAIKASLQRFGLQTPVVALADGTIKAGNGRWQAAKELGWETIAAIRLPKGLEHLADEYALADNRTAELARWNPERFKALIDRIKANGQQVQIPGFDKKSIDELLAEIKLRMPEKVVEDEAPGRPKTSRMKPGDLWALGNHRLYCGDSQEAKSYEALFGKEKATLVFTDPPYGVSIGKKNAFLNKQNGGASNQTDIENDDLDPKAPKEVLLKCFTVARKFLADDCAVFVCSPQGSGLGMMMMMMEEAGLQAKHILNWVKNGPTFSMGRLDYDYQHEPILFTWTKTHKRKKQGQFQTSLWAVNKPVSSKLHPTMKPVELPVNAILNHTDPGDLVLDNFGGSGTTLIACEQTKRKCRMIELDPLYCEVILQRWEALTNKKTTKI